MIFARLLRCLGFGAIAAASVAFGQTQASLTQNIRAGIVVLDADIAGGASYPQEAAAYTWYNLDSNTTIRPASWNIYNPNAPSVLTADMLARWEALDPNNVTAATAGTKLTKRNAAYWEVFLDTTPQSALSNYDVLLVNPGSYAALNPAEREKLRQFVDRGGILWIDTGALAPGAGSSDLINNFPVPFTPITPPGNAPDVSDQTNPLLQSPNGISQYEVNLLDDAFVYCYGIADPSLVGAAGYDGLFGGLASYFAQIQPVALSKGSPTIGVGRVGDGFEVITSRGASIKLSTPTGLAYTANRHFTAQPPVLSAEGFAAAKLAVNMISLLAEYRQQGGGAHKAFSTAIDLNPPLTRRSSIPGSPQSTAVVYKDMVAAILNDRIVVYDVDPDEDLDADGNPDDGVQDLIYGSPEDEIWQSEQLKAPLSTPVCAEVPDANGNLPVDQVMVIDGNGALNVFNMRPLVNGVLNENAATQLNVPPVYTLNPPNGAPDSTATPNAPTVHEEIAYVADSVSGGVGSDTGRVWAANLATGSLEASPASGSWQIGGPNTQVTMPQFTASPTVAYIPILDNSGGMARVMYLPFAGGSAGTPSSGFISLWLGARGERPTDFDPQPGTGATAMMLTVTTRASQQGGLPICTPASGPLAVKLVLLDANGNVMPAHGKPGIFGGLGMTDVFQAGPPVDQNGVLTFNFATGVTALPSQVSSIRVDYTIDWGNANSANLLSGVERGRINLPDVPGTSVRSILGPISVSPNGTIWLTDSASPSDGAVYAFREQGRGLFQMLVRYELHNSYPVIPSGGSQVTVPTSLTDNDGLTQMVPILGGVMTQYQLTGPVSIRNGQAFATATVLKGGIVYATVVMAFPAEPPVLQFVVGELPDGSSIVQPDLARSGNATTPGEAPDTMSILAGPNYNYDSTTGIVRFTSLSSIQKGQIQNSLANSDPILIRRPGQPDALVYPDAVGGSVWSPLLWYSVFHGLNSMVAGSGGVASGSLTNNVTTSALIPNGPFASGNSVFIAGSSSAPSFLATGTPGNLGVLYGINSNVSPNDPFIVNDSNRPWLHQYVQLLFSPTIQGNPGFLWPQIQGVTSMSDYLVRLNGATLSSTTGNNSSVTYGISGGDGALIAWGDQGLYTFAKSDFLIADQGRIADFDPSGNLLWSSNAFGSAGDTATSSAGTVQNIVRPTRVYSEGKSQILAVDPGSNSVALLTKGGVVSRSITSVVLDPNVVPADYKPNEPLALSGPRDALTYTSVEVASIASGNATATYANTSNSTVTSTLTTGDGEANGATEYWVHYVIADTGNHRLIEMVDRYYYNPSLQQVGAPVTITPAGGNPVPQVGVLIWHSPALGHGMGLDYNSISRVVEPTGTPGVYQYVYVAGCGGSLPALAESGLDPSAAGTVGGLDNGATVTHQSNTGNGGVVVFDPTLPNGMRVFNQLSIPGVGPNVLWNVVTKSWNSQAEAPKTILLGGVNAVTARLVPQQVPAGTAAPTAPSIAIMISTNSGVFEAVYTPGAVSNDLLPIDWLLPAEAYVSIRQPTIGPNAGIPSGTNAPLHAMYAKRLDNGDVLVVNGYYGQTIGGTQVSGEILELNGTLNAQGGGTISAQNFGFGPLSIQFQLPPIQNARGLVLPVFADRK